MQVTIKPIEPQPVGPPRPAFTIRGVGSPTVTLTSPVLLNSNSVAATSNSVDHQGQRQSKKRRREKHHRYSPDPQGVSPSKEHKRKRKRKSLDMENPNQQEAPRIKIKVLIKSVLGYQILLKLQHFKISLPCLPYEKEKVGF